MSINNNYLRLYFLFFEILIKNVMVRLVHWKNMMFYVVLHDDACIISFIFDLEHENIYV